MPVLRLCKFTATIAASDERRKRAREEKSLELIPVWKRYLSGAGKRTWGSGSTTTTLSPDVRLDALIDAMNRLDNLGYRRSATQKLFHKAFVVAVLKQIYGRDIHRHVGRLMRRFDVTQIQPDVIVCAIRRGGKTFAVGLFSASYISTQPGVTMNIYSTCKRTARKLQALIWKITVTLAGTSTVIQNYNQEELVVKVHGTTSTVNSLPASVEISYRGGSGGKRMWGMQVRGGKLWTDRQASRYVNSKLEMKRQGGMMRREGGQRCVWVLLAIIVIGTWISVGYSIANNTLLRTMTLPLTAGNDSLNASTFLQDSQLDVVMSNAASVLVQGLGNTSCSTTILCPAEDINCNICQCRKTSGTQPCSLTQCACASILDSSGNCATGSTLSKCTICALIPSRACSQ